MRGMVTMLVAAALLASTGVDAADKRQKIRLPAMMGEHMLANMRDHLQALQEIQTALAEGKLDLAADVAERRLGMSSLEAHGAAHMAPYMPQPMREIGTEMHHAASRFARSAQEGDLAKALADLSGITRQCVACHASYRVH
jgi:cytochrome c556